MQSLSYMQVDVKEIYALTEALKTGSGYDFGNYSTNSLRRRIIKIMNEFRISFRDLLERVNTDALFREEVVKKITVNTTDLFRDTNLWLSIREHVLPRFAKNEKIYIWHAGCSTGQEVYSMMIMLEEMNLLDKAEISATDLNTDVLRIARNGAFKYQFNTDYISNFDKVINSDPGGKFIPHSRYFETDPVNGRILMKDFLKQKPDFHKFDLVTGETKFKRKFDIVVCRNVIIYFNQELQNRVIDLFYRNMNQNACLILGMHETIIDPPAALFTKRNRIYYKRMD
ncbi:MAG: protein-glutamate O-methyltransferase CheR [Bacteroidales bacterium]|nr:protein-glutamate O-methyltransferase CheR [Bacteroidales bacterium]